MTHVIKALDTSGRRDRWNLQTGNPGIDFFASALQLWAYAQGRYTTVSEAADTFNVDQKIIRQAVAHHDWMEIGAKDTIVL